MRTLNGGWSYTWQGDGADREEFTGHFNTIYEALRNKFGSNHVTLVEGVSYDSKRWAMDHADNIGDAVAAAADNVLTVAGLDAAAGCYGQAHHPGAERVARTRHQRHRTFGKGRSTHHAAWQLWRRCAGRTLSGQ